MKKITTIIILIISLIPNLFSQTIKLKENEGGTFYIPCKVNDVDFEFIFDTGASLVSISLKHAKILIEKGTLTNEDIIGKVNLSIADGQIVDGTIIKLRKIQIGNLILNNIDAVVVHTQEAPLLFGQSAIKKFGKFKFDYDNSLLTIESNNKKAPKTIIHPTCKQNMTEYDIEEYHLFYSKKQEIIDEISVEVLSHKVTEFPDGNKFVTKLELTNSSDYDFKVNMQGCGRPFKMGYCIVTVLTENGKKYSQKMAINDIASTESNIMTVFVNLGKSKPKGYYIRFEDIFP